MVKSFVLSQTEFIISLKIQLQKTNLGFSLKSNEHEKPV